MMMIIEKKFWAIFWDLRNVQSLLMLVGHGYDHFWVGLTH